MKKLLLVLTVTLTVVSMLSGCIKKADVDEGEEAVVSNTEQVQVSSDGDSSDTVTSDMTGSDTIMSDCVESEGVEDEAEVSDAELLNGHWIHITNKKITVLTFNSQKNMCMRTVNGNSKFGNFKLDNGILDIEGDKTYEMSVTRDKLTLKKTPDGKPTEFERMDSYAKSLKKKDFVGRWTGSITAIKDDSEMKTTYILNDDGTCIVSMDDSTQSADAKATWELKKGVLTLDNGSGKESGKLKYTVLYMDGSVLTLEMDGYAVNFISEK